MAHFGCLAIFHDALWDGEILRIVDVDVFAFSRCLCFAMSGLVAPRLQSLLCVCVDLYTRTRMCVFASVSVYVSLRWEARGVLAEVCMCPGMCWRNDHGMSVCVFDSRSWSLVLHSR